MGIEKDSFVGNPNKPDYVDVDEELEYLSDDEFEFNPLGLPPGDPDLLINESYEIITDDDEDYQPDDYEDFLSDSEYEYGDDEGSESGLEQVFFSDSEQELPVENQPETDRDDMHSKTTSTNADRSGENKINADAKTNDTGGVDPNQTADT